MANLGHERIFAKLLLCFVAYFSVNLYSKLIFLFFCALEINNLENNLKIIVKKLVYVIYMIYICIEFKIEYNGT